jgi:predicted enzyme related to lactoylglutathione lyase
MFAQINHMAMISSNWPMMAKFYEAVFGLRSAEKPRPANGLSIGDGYVGMNINPQRDGYIGGLDHFGMVVDEVPVVLERMRKSFPSANIVKRPSTRPFAAYSGHDPDGNVFDLAEKGRSKLSEIYSDQNDGKSVNNNIYLNKFAIRTMNPDTCAQFYADVFELKRLNRPHRDGHYLTDGRVTLALLPWSIPIFEDMAIKRPGPCHIGFHVDDLDAFRKKVREVGGANPYLAPVPLGGSEESDARKAFFEKSATGKLQMSDPSGLWIDVTDE